MLYEGLKHTFEKLTYLVQELIVKEYFLFVEEVLKSKNNLCRENKNEWMNEFFQEWVKHKSTERFPMDTAHMQELRGVFGVQNQHRCWLRRWNITMQTSWGHFCPHSSDTAFS